VFTVPVLVKLSADHFLGLDAPTVDVTSLGVTMALITLAPAALGIALRHFSEGLALRLDGIVSKIAVVLFVIVVVGALASNWRIFVDNLAVLGPALVLLNLLLLAFGF